MHRTMAITVGPGATDRLCEQLEQIDEVVGLTVHRGASRKPPGDVLVVDTLNRGADAVLKLVAEARRAGPVSVATAELASIIDPSHSEIVEHDRDEAIWEEMETGLRHQGRVTPNFIALMALGGAVAATGLAAEPVAQVTAFVSASIIAPGFEPIAKIPLGLALRNWPVVRRGAIATVVGYAVLIAAAALSFLLLRITGSVEVSELVTNHEVEKLTHPTTPEFLLTACGATAGMIMIAAYRRSVIAGPLIALVVIPAAALCGAALVAGEWRLSYEGLERLAIDIALIIALGGAVVLIKQRVVHRRAPLV